MKRYRFKTRDEFIEEFGIYFNNIPIGSEISYTRPHVYFTGSMNKFFGEEIIFSDNMYWLLTNYNHFIYKDYNITKEFIKEIEKKPDYSPRKLIKNKI